MSRSDTNHIIARATFGMVQSFDGGQSWQWICERAIHVSGEVDPPLAVTADGTLVVLPPASSPLVSRDRGCTWTTTPEPLLDRRAVDLTVDPSDPAHVLILTSAVDTIDAQGIVSYANTLLETRDNAQTWTEVGRLPGTFSAETLEIAASDRARIYVGGTSSVDPLRGIVQRSSDGGKTWTERSLQLPPGSGSMFISGVDPSDPDRLWVRLPARGDRFGILPVTLIVSSDQGESWATLAATEKQAMLGFALSPDGKRLAYGGPGDGLYVGASDGSDGFTKVAELRVRCLRWNQDGLYVCGTESTNASQRGDPFSVGVSIDEGASFQAIYRMASTCPQECADTSGFTTTCKDVWSVLASSFGAAGESCSVPWARSVPPRDTGAGKAGVAEAGAAVPTTEAPADAGHPRTSSSSTGCAAAHGGRSGPLSVPVALFLLACLRIGFRRVAFLALACLLGCEDSSHTDAIANELDADTFVACPESIPELAPGTAFTGREEHIRVELLSASQLPARKYRNDWVLALTDAKGEPLGDVEVTRLEAFMPVHGHYSRPPAEFEPADQPGQLKAAIYFTMRGPWEVQLTASSASVGDDYVVLHVCVDE